MEVHFTVDIHETDGRWDAELTVYGGNWPLLDPIKCYRTAELVGEGEAIRAAGGLLRTALCKLALADGDPS